MNKRLKGLLFWLRPDKGRIKGRAVRDFGAGGNFDYRRRSDRNQFTSPSIRSLRGKSSDDNEGSISIVGEGEKGRNQARVRFDIPGGTTDTRSRLNVRSELATGRVFDADESVTIGLRFRVKNPDDLTGFAYLLQGWQPVQAPRFGLRVSTRSGGSWDVAARGSSFRHTQKFNEGQRWNTVIMDVRSSKRIDWYNGTGRKLGTSKGNFLKRPGARAVQAQVWRPKFGYYGDGSRKPNFVEMKDVVLGSKQSVFQALDINT